MLRLICFFVSMAAAFAAFAQEPARPVTASWMAGWGAARVTDAYLAPFPTTGWGAALMYERAQALRSAPGRWSRFLAVDLDISRTHTVGTMANGIMWGAALTAEMGAMRRYRPFASLPLGLAVGPSMEIIAGVHYRPANSNNPVSARAAVTLGVAARASWPLRIGRLPVELSYRPSLQLIGAFFAPAYGQLYYEIYMGDHRNLAHFAWPGNRLAYSHLLAADLRLGATSLRVGYSLRLSTQEACGLATNVARHLVVLGITTDFLSLSRRSPKPLTDNIQYAF